MGHIKEPKGVDFVIESKPLTDEDRMVISDFIRKDKEKHLARKNMVKRKKSEQLKKHVRQ